MIWRDFLTGEVGVGQQEHNFNSSTKTSHVRGAEKSLKPISYFFWELISNIFRIYFNYYQIFDQDS